MKVKTGFARELPIMVSSIIAALCIGFMVTFTSASDFEHTDHIMPFILAGMVGFWVLFLFIYPALVTSKDSHNDW